MRGANTPQRETNLSLNFFILSFFSLEPKRFFCRVGIGKKSVAETFFDGIVHFEFFSRYSDIFPTDTFPTHTNSESLLQV